MVSNLSTIGFTFASEAQFQASLERLVGAAIARLECPSGDYAIWRSRSGAEIWFHIAAAAAGDASDERHVVGLTPWFEGASTVSLTLREAVRRPDDNALEGGFLAWTAPRAVGEGAFPLVFEAVDFAAHVAREIPAVRRVRLTAFARTLAAYQSEAEHAAAASGKLALAPKAFLPLGLFALTAEEKGAATASAEAQLTGRILEARVHENEETGRSFHWLVVETLDMTIDVVADPEAVTGIIAPGGTVEIVALLFGRVVD